MGVYGGLAPFPQGRTTLRRHLNYSSEFPVGASGAVGTVLLPHKYFSHSHSPVNLHLRVPVEELT